MTLIDSVLFQRSSTQAGRDTSLNRGVVHPPRRWATGGPHNQPLATYTTPLAVDKSQSIDEKLPSRRRRGSQRPREMTSHPVGSPSVVVLREEPATVTPSSQAAPVASVAPLIDPVDTRCPQDEGGPHFEKACIVSAGPLPSLSVGGQESGCTSADHSVENSRMGCYDTQTRVEGDSSIRSPEKRFDCCQGGPADIFAWALREGSVECAVIGRRMDPDSVYYIVRLEVLISAPKILNGLFIYLLLRCILMLMIAEQDMTSLQALTSECCWSDPYILSRGEQLTSVYVFSSYDWLSMLWLFLSDS